MDAALNGRVLGPRKRQGVGQAPSPPPQKREELDNSCE